MCELNYMAASQLPPSKVGLCLTAAKEGSIFRRSRAVRPVAHAPFPATSLRQTGHISQEGAYPMISRIVSCTVKRDKVNEFRNTLKNELLPKITRERGFVDVIESIDNGTGT